VGLQDPSYGFITSIALGVLKEIVDSLGFGTPDPLDLAADLFGSAVGYLYSQEGLVILIWEF
jgi:uncharacterized protein YfiM (DUF2279 family)